MPDEKDPWPADLRKQWDATWGMPHMQAGLRELAKRCRKKPVPLGPGYDAQVFAAGEHHRSVGHQEIFDHIDEMRTDKPERKELPAQPFSREARGLSPLPETEEP